MYLNSFSVRIEGGNEQESGYVEMRHGTTYAIVMRNDRATQCDAEVSIDGKVVAVVDQYGPGRSLSFDWLHQSLPPGRHTIELRILNDKSKESKDRFINVAGFQAMP